MATPATPEDLNIRIEAPESTTPVERSGLASQNNTSASAAEASSNGSLGSGEESNEAGFEAPIAVVGLGASAGGIKVLHAILEGIPAHCGLAFVVVMHLSPDHESNLAQVLQLRSTLPVLQVTERVGIEANHIYVIPPNRHILIEDGHLVLTQRQEPNGKRVAIDLFFRTLAAHYGQRSVCAVLSGTDSDGVIGLKHIKEQGGVTIAQDPNEAEYDSMPRSAIGTGMVDWVLPAGQIAPRLLKFARNEQQMRLPPDDAPDENEEEKPGGPLTAAQIPSQNDEAALLEVLGILRAQTGHDFRHYKRATILRRVARRMQVNTEEDIPSYLGFLRQHPSEAHALLDDLLISVTNFFRDIEAFNALQHHIPQLFAGKSAEEPVRVWVCGCATGEEAYSIAILLAEHASRLSVSPPIQIFASDIDEEVIQFARAGVYPLTIEADVSPARLRRFFTLEAGRYRVRREIREMVLFASHNVLKDSPFSRLDLVTCRNLLIYLKSEAQERVFDGFHFALRAGGLMFLGSSESMDNSHMLFAPLDKKHRIFVRRAMARPIWQVPSLPESSLEALRPHAINPTVEPTAEAAPRTLHIPASHQPAPPRSASLSYGDLHLSLLEEYAPPSIIVTENHDIVHLSEHAGRFLQMAGGEHSMNLLKAVHPDLRIELRTALFRAEQTGSPASSAPVPLRVEGDTRMVTIRVRPARTTQGRGFILVVFEDADQNEVPLETLAPPEPATRQLEAELQLVKAQLSSTVEQYEASTEELKASNEELQAMNEELRSATEELQTSKEELQSVNEELITVNHELKTNLDEVGNANSDLQNLLTSTEIGTIFLDRQLRIKRFTPRTQELFNLIPSDAGRPLSDITHKLSQSGFSEAAERVLRDLAVVEQEVRNQNGLWFLARMLPYRTLDDRINGVVLTFVDITERKNAEESLRQTNERLTAIFQQAAAGLSEIGLDGRFTRVNDELCRIAGRSREELVGFDVEAITHPDDRSRSSEAVQKVLGGSEPQILDKRYLRSDGTAVWANSTIASLRDEQGHVKSLLAVTIDLSQRKEAEEKLQRSEAQLRTLANAVPQIIWTNDSKGRANYFNSRWFDYSGLSLEDSLGLGWQAIVHPDDDEASTERWHRSLERGETFDTEYRLRCADGAYRWHIGRNVPVKDEEGRVLNWFGSATDIEDLKHTEAALRESEERFRVVVEGTRDYAILLMDAERRVLHWNPGAESTFGWSREEALGQSGDIIFTLEDREAGAPEQEARVATRQGRAEDKRWHLRKDGSLLWVEGVMSPLYDESGGVRGFVKIARDATKEREAEEKLRRAHDEMEARVSERTSQLADINEELRAEVAERMRSEEALRASEHRFAQVFHACPIPLAIISLESQFLDINAEGLSFFDCERDDIIGHSAEEFIARAIIPTEQEQPGASSARPDAEPERRDAKRQWLRVLRESSTRPVEGRFWARHSNEVRDALATAVLLEQDTTPVVLVMFLDITERKRAEQAREQLLQRVVAVQEEERVRISRELHDQMSQNLAVLLMGLNAQTTFLARVAPDAPQETERVNALKKLASELIDRVHRLAWELRPGILDSLGLQAALKQYVADWSKESGVRTQFVSRDVSRLMRLPPHIETAFYRITQEALANVQRHAQARNVSVLLHRMGNDIALIIEDDGLGFDATPFLSGPRQPGHLGVLGMSERMEGVRGTLTIESEPGGGTTLHARAPLDSVG
jgi:two-component system CheB/CheR fusion protein